MHTPAHKVRTLGDVIDRVRREEQQATAHGHADMTDTEFLFRVAATLHAYPSSTVERLQAIAHRLAHIDARQRMAGVTW